MFSFFKKTWRTLFESLKRSKQKNSLHRSDLELMKKMRKNKFPSLRQFFSINKVLSFTEKIVFFSALIVFTASIVWGVNVLAEKYGITVPKVGGEYTEGLLGSPQLINPLFSSLNEVDQDLVAMI